YYAGVSYFAIYCVTYYGLRFLGIFFHFVKIERLDQTRFQVASGVLASLVSLVPLTMLGNILATVPINNIQTVLSSSWFLRFLINWNFPVSQIIQHLWTSVI
ncbi:CvpA family protein, partial [Streptococcus vestibularis]|nr:CvpA family protein [Streptococcus vestibularis]